MLVVYLRSALDAHAQFYNCEFASQCPIGAEMHFFQPTFALLLVLLSSGSGANAAAAACKWKHEAC